MHSMTTFNVFQGLTVTTLLDGRLAVFWSGGVCQNSLCQLVWTYQSVRTSFSF
jgi:hypothetical protein